MSKYELILDMLDKSIYTFFRFTNNSKPNYQLRFLKSYKQMEKLKVCHCFCSNIVTKRNTNELNVTGAVELIVQGATLRNKYLDLILNIAPHF